MGEMSEREMFVALLANMDEADFISAVALLSLDKREIKTLYLEEMMRKQKKKVDRLKKEAIIEKGGK
jgi:hypothetical protein